MVKKNLFINISEKLFYKVKVAAFKRGDTIRDFTEQALKHELRIKKT